MMKKTLILAATAAAALVAAAPASAAVYDYSGLAKALFGSSSAAFTMSIDDSTKLLTASVTTTTNNFDGGLGINCCSATGTQPAVMFTAVGNTPGTYNYSIDLSNLSSYDAGFLALNGGTADGAFAALLTGMNTVVNATSGGSIARVVAWTNATANINGAVIPSPVPEPATYGLMGLGLGLLAWRRRQQNAA